MFCDGFRLFTEIPSALGKFSAFGSVAVSDLPSNAAFNAQVKLVADRLDSMIASMDNTLQILGQIEYMGHSHKPRSVGRQEFAVSFNFSKWKSLFCIDHI